MDQKENGPEAPAPAYITKKDKDIATRLGKLLLDKVRWTDLSSKELMEVYHILMWFNALPKKLEDNVFQVEAFTPAAPAPSDKPKRNPRKTSE